MRRRGKRALVKAGVVAVLLGAVAGVFIYRQGGFIRDQVSAESSVLMAGDEGLALMTRVGPAARDVIYFVMVDRFANGDPSNDTGAGGAGPLEHGYDPTRPEFYHGGDLVGLREKLGYIQGLGATALWLTPVLTNKPVQMDGDQVLTTGYHGYHVTDYTQVDPHLGTNQDLVDLVEAAHRRGMKVFLDVTLNHTADVITYEGAGRWPGYRTKATYPYTDVNGVPFDDAVVAGSDDFPELGPDSFPYSPVVPADQADVKAPAWLNDVTMYHNRGDTRFQGESWTYGDWAGMDDVFTERPEVVDGLIDIYSDLIRWTGVDGFRLDSARHVNLEFWREFVPAIKQAAAEVGVPDFFLFGEVQAGYPDTLDYARRSDLPALLDFPLQAGIEQFAEGLPPGHAWDSLCPVLDRDLEYAGADSDAYASPTFVGNHDMGRIALRLWGSDPDEESWLHRVHFAYETLFLLRGQPVVYYGDEQGFTGHGGGDLARQDMFASRTPQYLDNVRQGTDAGSDVDAYDTSHPTYRLLTRLAQLRYDHPALADGVQVQRTCPTDARGVVAFSRIHRDTGTEYVVALNNAKEPTQVTIGTWTPDATFTTVYASEGSVPSHPRSTAAGQLTVTVPAMGALVLRPERPMAAATVGPSVRLRVFPAPWEGWLRVQAEVSSPGWVLASFYADRDGPGPAPRELIAVDDAQPTQWITPIVGRWPRGALFDAAGLARGSPVEFTVVVRNLAGREASTHLEINIAHFPGWD
ncbi:MAG: alpha-amylase family glycosyl hydrolase [Candidatus Nanopelagicales bacterium]